MKKSINWTEQLTAAIRFYHEQTGMKYTVIGRHAINDSRLWQRLINGGNTTLANAEHILSWLASQGYHINPEGEPYHDTQDTEHERKSRRKQRQRKARRQEKGEEQSECRG